MSFRSPQPWAQLRYWQPEYGERSKHKARLSVAMFSCSHAAVFQEARSESGTPLMTPLARGLTNPAALAG